MSSLEDVQVSRTSQLRLEAVGRVPRSGCYGGTAYDRCHRIMKISLNAVPYVSVCTCQVWWTYEYRALHN